MDPLFSYTDVHTSSKQMLSFIFKKSSSVITHCKKPKSVVMSTISPAHTTTQLLLSNTQPCILPQRIIDLSMLLQSNSKMSMVSSTGIGPLKRSKPIVFEERKPSAAQQPKKPLWTESHAYLRAPRTNGDSLRIISAELDMIRALKITRSLKPRRSYLPRRKDSFVWGLPSSLRITETCTI